MADHGRRHGRRHGPAAGHGTRRDRAGQEVFSLAERENGKAAWLLARTFQKLKPFPDLTVTENVIVGALARTSDMKTARDQALESLAFVDLLEKRNHFARELSTGQRKRLELARGLAMSPRLILMDEVTGGVDQRTIAGLIELVLELKHRGLTIVTIEHNMQVIMRLADRILALHAGRRIAFGTPEQVRSEPAVVDAYLGTIDDAA